MTLKTADDTNAWNSLNDCINFGAERYIRETNDLIRRINIWLGMSEREIIREELDRNNRLAEIITLGILDKTLKPNSIEFYQKNDAMKRLINKGVITQKKRGGWKINKKADPRT